MGTIWYRGCGSFQLRSAESQRTEIRMRWSVVLGVIEAIITTMARHTTRRDENSNEARRETNTGDGDEDASAIGRAVLTIQVS